MATRLQAASAALLLGAGLARAQSVVYVNSAAPAGGDGATWATAYNNLHSALATAGGMASAASPAEVWVVQGIYNPAPPGGDRSISFVVPDHVSVYGGFAGGETSRAQADPSAHVTQLHGDLNGDDISGARSDNSYRVVVCQFTSFSPRLDGLLIAGGHADGAVGSGLDQGGGVTATYLKMTRCQVIANWATTRGGGVFANVCDIQSCFIAGNKATAVNSSGGNVYLLGGPFNQRRFVDCTINSGSAGWGSGVMVEGLPRAIYKRCTFAANVNTNFSVSALPWGSAVGDQGDMINCLLVGNEGYAAYHGDGLLVNCVIARNTGVGIKGNATCRNCVIAYNIPGQGVVRGGGIDTNNSGTALLYNTIIWANQCNLMGNNALWQAYCSENLFPNTFYPRGQFNYCTIQNFLSSIFPGAGNNSVDPLFVNPWGADGLLGTTDDDYRLQAGSPVVDSGDASNLPADTYDIDDDGDTSEAFPLDMAGQPRRFDDLGAPNTGPGAAPHVDRGAYERAVASSTWLNAVGGAYNTAANWIGGVPNGGIRAAFDGTAGGANNAYTVTFPSSQQAYSLRLGAGQVTLNFRSGTTNGDLTLASPVGDPVVPLLVTRVDPTGLTPRLTITNTAGPLTRRALSAAAGVVALEAGSRGDLVVASPRAQLTVGGDLRIGARGLGSLSVQQRGLVQTGSLNLGGAAGAAGIATVTGELSSPATLAYGGAGTELVIGDGGVGQMLIGSALDAAAPGLLDSSGNAADRVVIGRSAGAMGTVTLNGPLSGWSADQADFVIGQSGSATLEVLGGAQLVTNSTNSVVAAQNPGSSANIHIGAGSSWSELTQGVVIGGAGTATLTVDDGGTVSAAGGVLRIAPTGQLTGGGTVAAGVFNVGVVSPGSGAGTLTVDGEYQQISSDPQNPDSGTLQVDVGGTSAGQYDKLAVTGVARLGGGLRVAFTNGFAPAPGQPLTLELVTSASRDPLNPQFNVALLPGLNDGRYLRVTYGGLRGPNGSVNIGIAPLPGAMGFNNPNQNTVDGNPSGVAVGDLNGDGFADVAVTVPDTANPTANPGSVIVLFNGGNGPTGWNGFSSSAQISLNFGGGSVGRQPSAVAIANFDGASGNDLAIANASSNNVLILQNLGAGTFALGATLPTGNEPRAVAAGNLDGINGSDLVVANAGEDSGFVFLNQGGGGFGFLLAPTIPTGRRPVSIDPFDPDGDKDLDLTFATSGPPGSSSGTLTLVRNVGAGGSFVASAPVQLPVGSGAVQVISGDLNGDNRLDLVAVNQSSGSVSVIVNTGNAAGAPTFAPHVELPVGSGPSSIARVDLDQDGDLDLAVLGVPQGGSPQVSVLRNDTNGGSQLQFAPAAALSAGPQPQFLVSADVDRNGRTDLVSVNAGGLRGPGVQSEVYTIPNNSTPPCPADWDRNGLLQSADIAGFVNDWFASLQQGTLLGDFDRNGQVLPADIGVFVTGWFGALSHGC